MPRRAILFIGAIISAGILLTIDSLMGESRSAHLLPFLVCNVLSMLTSTFKVRLPGLTGTISVNFVFILIAIAAFSYSEAILLAGFSGLVQCVWNAKSRPKPLQVAFNMASLALSSGLAYRASHALIGKDSSNLAMLLAVASCFYFTMNTLLVSTVLALLQNKPVKQIWLRCYLWTFPYYLAGALLSGMIVSSSITLGWTKSFLILPLMYLIYLFYKTCVEHLARNSQSTTPGRAI
jgi:hypothetical protein